MGIITAANRPNSDRTSNGLDRAVVLLFARGKRPSASEIQALSTSQAQFAVTLECLDPNEENQWVELLANGLTFDLSGLEPGKPCAAPPSECLFDLEDDFDPAECEGVALLPGPHLTSGGPMVPVLRCLAWLGAELSGLEHLKGIAWQPAGTICGPDYFSDSVLRWIGGGAFPGLGLTSLSSEPDGSLISKGMALFTGQELRLDAELALDKAHGAKLALRLLHWLVENGKVDESMSFTGPSGDTLMLEPSPEEGIVTVWRGSR